MQQSPFLSFIFIITGSLIISCCNRTADCRSGQPKDLKDLSLKGGRTRSNVIFELWRIQCRLRKFHETNYPDLKGFITVMFTADYTGELSSLTVKETDIRNDAFLKKIQEMFDYNDFTFWGANHEDTEITYTFTFNK